MFSSGSSSSSFIKTKIELDEPFCFKLFVLYSDSYVGQASGISVSTLAMQCLCSICPPVTKFQVVQKSLLSQNSILTSFGKPRISYWPSILNKTSHFQLLSL